MEKYGTGRQEERPRRRSMDVILEDTQEVGVTEEDVGDRLKWRLMIFFFSY